MTPTPRPRRVWAFRRTWSTGPREGWRYVGDATTPQQASAMGRAVSASAVRWQTAHPVAGARVIRAPGGDWARAYRAGRGNGRRSQ